MKKVSILIPVYNQEKLIKKCLDSIPNRDDIEIIIVDDCSTDNSKDIIKSYPRKIKYIRNDVNIGIGLTRNVLIENASGEYIFFLDSDDYLYTDNFNIVVDKLLKGDIVENIHKQNNGHEWYCHVYRGTFIRREFAVKEKFKNVRCHEDTYWKQDLQKHKPTSSKSGKLVYHYNFPRDGSITSNEKKHKDLFTIMIEMRGA